MANITKTKQERVPILFALGLVLVLALIAITLVAPNAKLAFRGVILDGKAQVPDAWKVGATADAPLGSIDNPLPYDGDNSFFDESVYVINPDADQFSSVNLGDYFSNEGYVDGPLSNSSVSLSSSRNTYYDPFNTYFSGGNSSMSSTENFYAGSAVTTPSTASQAQSAANSVGNAVNSAFGSVFGNGTGGGAAGSAGTAGTQSTAGSAVLAGNTSGNFSAPTSAAGKNTGVNKAAATAVNCTGTACQFQNPLGTKNSSLDIFLNSILDVIILIGGIVVVIMIILAGLKYVTAQGDESKIESAHKQLTWTVVGAGILLGAKVIALVIQNTVKALT